MIVSIEGIDGAGKRTLARHLADEATAAGVEVRQLSFPRYGRSVTSSSISALLATGVKRSTADARFAATLFATERLESLSTLHEFASTAGLIIVDRYVHSNMAYQGARALERDRDELLIWIESLEFEVFGIPRPDLTVLIDVDLRTSLSRTRDRPLEDGRPAQDAYERDRALLDAARRIYLDLHASGQHGDWVLVSASDEDASDATAREIWTNHIRDVLTKL